MTGFSQQDIGQYIVVDNPEMDPSQLSGRVGLFKEDGTPFTGGEEVPVDLSHPIVHFDLVNRGDIVIDCTDATSVALQLTLTQDYFTHDLAGFSYQIRLNNCPVGIPVMIVLFEQDSGITAPVGFTLAFDNVVPWFTPGLGVAVSSEFPLYPEGAVTIAHGLSPDPSKYGSPKPRPEALLWGRPIFAVVTGINP